MKKVLQKLTTYLSMLAIATSAMAVKINAPGDINNFGPAVVSAMSGLYISPSRQILTSSPLAGGGDLTADRTISLGTLGTAGTYGDATHTNVITTDAYGRISAITPTVITGVAASTAVTLVTPRTIAIQTGDVTSPGASFDGSANETAATTLATVNANVGACGSATQSSVVTLNAKGLATACTSTTITNTTGNSATATALATSRTIAILTGDVTSPGAGFTGAANETAAATLATVNSNVGTFGSASAVPSITVNGKGLITAVTTSALGTAATQNTGTSGATIPFLNGTNTWSGANTFSTSPATFGLSAGTGYNIVMTSAAGTDRRFQFQTGTSVRWVFGATSTAESGGNAGSDFLIRGFDDTGTTINSTVITRSTGGWAFPSTISAAARATMNNGLNVNTSSSTQSIFVTDTGSNGANIQLTGNGATTPSKFIRAFSGSLQVINSANSAVILGLNDAGGLSVPSSIVSSGSFVRPGVTTVAGLATVDSSPQAGDMLAVSDAVTCVTNTTPTGGGSTTCPVVYSGAAWKAMVTH